MAEPHEHRSPAEVREAQDALAATLPGDAAVRFAGPGDPDLIIDPLWPDELTAIEKAIPTRQREFAIGRTCARKALVHIGGQEAAIPKGPSREPIWPAGYVGAITHTRDLIGAAVSSASSCASLGIDVEIEGAVSEDLQRQIMTEPERQFAARHSDLDLQTVFFSAKEAIYKTTFPVARQWLGFEDVTVEVDMTGGTFVANIDANVDHIFAGLAIDGRVLRALGHVMTSSSLPAA